MLATYFHTRHIHENTLLATARGISINIYLGTDGSEWIGRLEYQNRVWITCSRSPYLLAILLLDNLKTLNPLAGWDFFTYLVARETL